MLNKLEIKALCGRLLQKKEMGKELFKSIAEIVMFSISIVGAITAYMKPKQVYVEARSVAMSTCEARNLGLKWNMLQNGVCIQSVQGSAGVSPRKMPSHVKVVATRFEGARPILATRSDFAVLQERNV